jgi:hypothetical protein
LPISGRANGFYNQPFFCALDLKPGRENAPFEHLVEILWESCRQITALPTCI